MTKLELHQLVPRYAGLRILDAGRVSRLAASIGQDGQQTPVLVTAEGVLVDGYHRVEALRLLRLDHAEALELPLAEAEALVLAWRLETGRRKSALEEGWLLAELVEAHGRSLADLAGEMRRSKAWVSERIGLVRVLPDAVQDAVRKRKIPANAAAKSLVPWARADQAACEAVVGGLPANVTVRQVERVYAAWRAADAEGRARIVAQPQLLLLTEEAVSSVPTDDRERLERDFDLLAGLCRRARRQVEGGAFPRGNRRADGAWKRAEGEFRALEEEVGRARS